MIASSSIPKNKVAKLQKSLEGLLKQQGRSVIKTQMAKDCGVAVLIPVYNEQISLLIRPLLSLAGQQGVNFSQFEVVLVINNSLNEALGKTEAFLFNQKVL